MAVTHRAPVCSGSGSAALYRQYPSAVVFTIAELKHRSSSPTFLTSVISNPHQQSCNIRRTCFESQEVIVTIVKTGLAEAPQEQRVNGSVNTQRKLVDAAAASAAKDSARNHSYKPVNRASSTTSTQTSLTHSIELSEICVQRQTETDSAS